MISRETAVPVEDLVTWLDAPPPGGLPERLPDPFDEVPPHPAAAAVARGLQVGFARGQLAPGVAAGVLDRPEGGKMFGVLLVREASGRVGWLKAFSGQLGGTWEQPGWAPPLFDAPAREALERASDALVKRLEAEEAALQASPALAAARAALRAGDEATATARAALQSEIRERRRERGEARARLAAAGLAPRALGLELGALDELSRRDDLARRQREAGWRAAREALAGPARRLERRLGALQRLRRLVSVVAMQRIHDCYQLRQLGGGVASLRSLFAPGEPPWGAGDCAAPKLLAAALRLGLEPRALAEFWWGPPPPSGSRVQGHFFPACAPKCGPVLPFLLEGLDRAPRRRWRPRAGAVEELRVLHQDARVVAVLKPPGVLSVPARDQAVTESLWAWLRARFPAARGPLLVHRLDLDTSGVVLATLDLEAYHLLQAQFVARTVEKHYLAWLEGTLTARAGRVELPLRVDLEQRPRQLVDPVHGRPAVTDWEALEERQGRTRVRFTPLTGRTHQLRVHAAHARGLGTPIVGDRLYGQAGERLLLHAERIIFVHPDGHRLSVEAPAPF